MEDLIARLQAATGPDRELDAAIEAMVDGPEVRAAGGDIIANEAGICRWQEPPPHGSGTGQWRAARLRYTALVDAALTLVPDGTGWTLSGGVMEICTAGIKAPPTGDPDGWWVLKGTGSSPKRQPALALCIAALRARA
jgi:hypothetical protein